MKKITFLGLDDAGKSSIILSLQREFSKIAYLKPTKGIERRFFTFFGESITEHDLGGQSTYRITYISNPDKYLDNTAICIYTIDIQNEERIPESLDYLKELVQKYTELELQPTIHIFFHKYDPLLFDSQKMEIEKKCEEIEHKLRNDLHYEKLYFYKTSIYDFAKLMKIISEIFLEIHPKSTEINSQIELLAKAMAADGAILLDDNSLIVGEHYKNEDTKKIFYSSTPYLLTLNDAFVVTDEDVENSMEEMVIEHFNKFFLFKPILLDGSELPYYLVILKENDQFNETAVEIFKRELKELLSK